MTHRIISTRLCAASVHLHDRSEPPHQTSSFSQATRALVHAAISNHDESSARRLKAPAQRATRERLCEGRIDRHVSLTAVRLVLHFPLTCVRFVSFAFESSPVLFCYWGGVWGHSFGLLFVIAMCSTAQRIERRDRTRENKNVRDHAQPKRNEMLHRCVTTMGDEDTSR